MVGMKKRKSFSKEATALRIVEWYKCPCLYNKAGTECHDKSKRDLAKQRIAKALMDAFELDIDATTGECANFPNVMYLAGTSRICSSLLCKISRMVILNNYRVGN